MHFTGTITYNGNEPVAIEGVGSGPIESFFNALSHVGITGYKFKNYADVYKRQGTALSVKIKKRFAQGL